MCKDKRMFALIIAIFISVIFITGWVFADHTVVELIGVTPIFEVKTTDPAPAAEAVLIPALNTGEAGICLVSGDCD